MGKLNNIINYLNNNGFLIFTSELIRRACTTWRAFFYRRIFINRLGSIGAGAYIRGVNSIKINDGFSCGKTLWIEAIHQYRGITYNPVIKIGHSVYISNNVHISSINSIEIGDNVLIGSNVYIGDHSHGCYGIDYVSNPRTPPADRSLYSPGPVEIGNNVWIADGVVICGGVRIGNGSVIGANSVVTKDIPSNVVATGVPAHPIKRFTPPNKWVRLNFDNSINNE